MDTVFKTTVLRLIDNANDAVNEARQHKGQTGSEYYEARKLAYYEVLDTIKNDLIIADLDPADYGLGVDLEKTYL